MKKIGWIVIVIILMTGCNGKNKFDVDEAMFIGELSGDEYYFFYGNIYKTKKNGKNEECIIEEQMTYCIGFNRIEFMDVNMIVTEQGLFYIEDGIERYSLDGELISIFGKNHRATIIEINEESIIYTTDDARYRYIGDLESGESTLLYVDQERIDMLQEKIDMEGKELVNGIYELIEHDLVEIHPDRMIARTESDIAVGIFLESGTYRAQINGNIYEGEYDVIEDEIIVFGNYDAMLIFYNRSITKEEVIYTLIIQN